MADVFISYAREDRDVAKALAARLERDGWTVWWDRKISPGHRFEDVIQEQLDTARCVIVLWSKVSTRSDYVRDEAEVGKSRDALVPVLIEEGIKPPLGTRGFHATNLPGWPDREDAEELASLLGAVERLAPRQATAGTTPTTAPARESGSAPEHGAGAGGLARLLSSKRHLAVIGVVVLMSVGLAVGWLYFGGPEKSGEATPADPPVSTTPSGPGTGATGPKPETSPPTNPITPRGGNTESMRWFLTTFGSRLDAVTAKTPFTPEFLAAIALQETGHIWGPLHNQGMSEAALLSLCVGNTIDADRGRQAFPKNKADLLSRPRGDEMFKLARHRLEELAKAVPAFAGAAKNPDKFVRGFGIFQRDLAFFPTDPDYFLQEKWRSFEESASQAIKELETAKVRAGLGSASTLTDTELVQVAIAYSTGSYSPDKGLKQGHQDARGVFYGERIFDYLRLAKVAAESIGNVPAYAPAAGVVTRNTLAGGALINEPGRPERTGANAAQKVAQLDAIVDWLAVDTSARYQPRAGATFSNVYAADFAALAGVYVPRVWWTQDALARQANGEDVPVRVGSTVTEQRTNALCDWFRDFGSKFGWRRAPDVNALQKAANGGAVAIICARRAVDGRAGHMTIVVPESANYRAVRSADGNVDVPLQSQAGAKNFKRGTMGQWWTSSQFSEFAFWIHE